MLGDNDVNRLHQIINISYIDSKYFQCFQIANEKKLQQNQIISPNHRGGWVEGVLLITRLSYVFYSSLFTMKETGVWLLITVTWDGGCWEKIRGVNDITFNYTFGIIYERII